MASAESASASGEGSPRRNGRVRPGPTGGVTRRPGWPPRMSDPLSAPEVMAALLRVVSPCCQRLFCPYRPRPKYRSGFSPIADGFLLPPETISGILIIDTFRPFPPCVRADFPRKSHDDLPTRLAIVRN